MVWKYPTKDIQLKFCLGNPAVPLPPSPSPASLSLFLYPHCVRVTVLVSVTYVTKKARLLQHHLGTYSENCNFWGKSYRPRDCENCNDRLHNPSCRIPNGHCSCRPSPPVCNTMHLDRTRYNLHNMVQQNSDRKGKICPAMRARVHISWVELPSFGLCRAPDQLEAGAEIAAPAAR